MQPVQVGQLEPVGHLRGDLAGDGEVTFGFLPPTSRCGDETGTSLYETAVQGNPSPPELDQLSNKGRQCSCLLMQAAT